MTLKSKLLDNYSHFLKDTTSYYPFFIDHFLNFYVLIKLRFEIFFLFFFFPFFFFPHLLQISKHNMFYYRSVDLILDMIGFQCRCQTRFCHKCGQKSHFGQCGEKELEENLCNNILQYILVVLTMISIYVFIKNNLFLIMQ